MQLHLLRHADAENLVTTDSARVLTAKGQAQAARVGDFLVRADWRMDLILTSPYLRALQTAQAVAGKLGSVSLREDPRLACGLSPQTGLAIIQEHRDLEHLLIVGHQPDLGFFAAYLMTVDHSLHIEFSKASLLTISMPCISPASGLLQSFVNAGQM